MSYYPIIPSRRINSWARRRNSPWLRRFITILFILFLAFTAATVVAFAWLSKDLPSPYKLTDRQVDQSTQIYDRNGVLLYDIYGDKNRTLVPLKDIPQNLKNATIAIEDKTFYTNQGFDITGIIRAIRDIAISHNLSGGSTITQQLVKNTLLSNEQTIVRKIKEFILSIQIDRRYSKDEILQIYFNEIPYGGTAWGAEAGAQEYFGKSVKDLNLLESAILAGLPQSPTYYSPFGAYPEAYKDRTKEVLRQMNLDGYIDNATYQKTLKELASYQFTARPAGILKAPQFVLYVRNQLVQRYGEKLVMSGGLKVTTTLDYRLQQAAEDVVKHQVDTDGKNYHYFNAAAMVSDPKTGEVLAMVGSKDYFGQSYPPGCIPGSTCLFDPQVNVTLQARQPGSTIKPVNYVTGLKKGYTAATLFLDQKTDFPCPSCPGGVYTPLNGDRKFGHGHNGLILMRNALAESLDVPAVEMLSMNGIPSMIQTAQDLGITNWNDPSRYGLSLTLGGAEVKMVDMMNVYSAFANGGLRTDTVTILKVTDANGNVLEQYTPTPGRRVLDPGYAYIISNILSDSDAKIPTFGYVGSKIILSIPGHHTAVKTGTTDQVRDNWTMGYTPSYVVGAWVGNSNNDPLQGRFASGLTGAAPIWHGVMQKVLDITKTPDQDFAVPDDVTQQTVDAIYGTKPQTGDPTKQEWFMKSNVPQDNATNVKTLQLCTDQKKLANPADIAAGMAYNQVFISVNDGVHQGVWQPFDPPTDYCTAYRGGADSNQILVKIDSPASGATVSPTFTVTAEALGPYPITRVEFYLDPPADGSSGGLVATDTSAPYSASYGPVSAGTHTILVKAYDSQGITGSATLTVTASGS